MNGGDIGGDLLHRVLADEVGDFALLHRPDSGDPDLLDVLSGEVALPETLAQIPLPAAPATVGGGSGTDGAPVYEALVLVPYRQLAERGFIAPDDGAPLVAMTVAQQQTVSLGQALTRLPNAPTTLANGRFEVEDEDYAKIVRKIVAEEIGTGEGANFVIKRSFTADIGDYGLRSALSFFRRLLEREQGAYWTFLVRVGERTLVGATPERHITLRGGNAVMNPISGTYRYPPSGPTLSGIADFLADQKEADELYMVVDEELKMMARICDSGGRVVGPYLKEMARLAHTEYFIEGRTTRDVRDVLRETMFAPTVTGSPLESACRVIRRYEPAGRGYYSGVAALIGRDADGERLLDSAILIRTADISPSGAVRIDVGATLVRHSDPASEVAETRAKAAGLLGALEAGQDRRYGRHPRVRAALERRNEGIASFWLRGSEKPRRRAANLVGRTALVVDAEDTFAAMIAHQLRAGGLAVTVRRFDEEYSPDEAELVVMGPGPGDPSSPDDPRIGRLHSAIGALLETRQPFLAVCLSHQILSLQLGLALARREVPNQGVQREIDLFGARETVGFYNTYAAQCPDDEYEVKGIGLVEVSRDPDSAEVHALRGPRFASVQFHAESVLTIDGPRILAEAAAAVLAG
jgi:2-amino-4-deoxychorismate synthase